MTVTVHVLRALHLSGHRVEPGVELDLEPLQAALMLDSGRVRLVHQHDAAEVAAARKADIEKTMRAMNPSRGYANPPSPWVQR